MRIAIIGAGPAGLYFALLMRKAGHEVAVHERNAAGSTFGWGVVFSDQTLGALRLADAPTAERIHSSFNHWDDIDVHFKGHRIRSSGHGFCGIGRMRLLALLQERCAELGVQLHFEDERADDEALDADLIIAADGLNSRLRAKYASTYQPDVDLRACRFVWLGTKRLFDAFTFDFQHTPAGWFQAHAYRFDDSTSTFIVETHGDTWHRAGLEQMGKEEGIAFCERLFADVLQGEKLMSNAQHLRGSSQWIRFPRVLCQRWVHHNAAGVPVVLMGDAAHTAHFSIGSGTKLALEDAIDLSQRMAAHAGDLGAALAAYEAVRGVEVLKIQNAARNSTEWFENVERHARLAPEQFAYSLLTRSQRISHENLRLRDAAYVGQTERWLAGQAKLQARVQTQPHSGAQVQASASAAVAAVAEPAPAPMFTPFKLRDCVLPNRVVVSPMAQYSAQDGVPGDFHLVHLGARALGGAGLVFAEMTCPSANARITPGCPGLWNDAQELAWTRIVQFVHQQSPAKIALQLGHAGPKGSTCAPWDGVDDAPLPSGNWPLLAPSALPFAAGVSATPQAMTASDMQQVLQSFVQATERAARAGFDWLELHCAHGYLLSAFLSPLTNLRQDAFGGRLSNRLRYPLQVFAAMRAVWPRQRPMSVRLSAHDWVPGGNTVADAVAMAQAFKAAGCDLIDVSSGQVSKAQKPVYGRMYQTPFAESIRNEVGIATMAVGAITEADHVNSIIAAGRADLCALARPHLANPAWTLHEAAKLGDTGAVAWPRQYLAGKSQLERELARQKAVAAQAAGLSPQEQALLALGV